jgi:hypothetical protein
MRDFTLTIYKNLLTELLQAGYRFVTFAEYIESKPGDEKLIILRHDVDRLPEQALRMAKIEHEMGVKASYYFRCQRNGFEKNIITDVAALGHEIGYHYENMGACRGNKEKAWDDFRDNLADLRKTVPVKTICRHGSPMSKWDNAEIWTYHDYKQSGIIGEPYFDIDFSQVFYISDTGRKWNNENSNIRDRVNSGFKIKIRNTGQLIFLLNKGQLPGKVMINTHPQRWSDQWLPWIWELCWQNVKNGVKYFVARGSS